MSEPWFESSDTRTVLRSYKRPISEAWVAHLRIMRFFKRLIYRGIHACGSYLHRVWRLANGMWGMGTRLG
jgi:hypothetical protein